jgi:glycine oxidase
MKIGIAGAGIMGRLLAFDLVNAGHEICLYDQNDIEANTCSMAAAGMLAPVTELEKSGQLIYELGIKSLNLHWPEIIRILGNQVYFKTLGSLVVAHPKDQAELLNFISQIDGRLPVSALYQDLDQQELAVLEPQLAKFQQAYYLPAEGQVDNQALMVALGNYLLEKKVEWRMNTRVVAIESHTIMNEKMPPLPNPLLHLESDGGEGAEHRAFDLVFDCRGLGATETFKELQAVRGELIWLHAPDVKIKRPVRFMHPRYSLYIAPRPDNIYLIGASEIYAEDYSGISVRSMLELLTAAYYLHPGFAEARIIKTVTHCRPGLPDLLPKIKVSKDSIAINGLYRHGYLIAPAISAEILGYMKDGRNHDHDLFEFH